MGKNLRTMAILWLFRTIIFTIGAINIYFIPNLFSLSLNNAYATTPTFWKETGYIYSANQTPIRKILEDFCNQFGITLDISPSIKGTINGRIAANNAVEFLDRLALMRKFRWFVYANTLYITPINDNVIEKIKTTSDSSAETKQAIIGIGLFEQRFGWGELPEEQSVIVSGPKQYVTLVKKVLGKSEGRKIDSEIMIFRLKYANADDREIQYRNRIVITPGVASILRNLLQDKRSKGAGNGMDLAETARNTYAGFPGNAMSTSGLSPNPMGPARGVGNTMTGQGARPPLNPFSFLSGGNGAEASTNLDESLAMSANNNYLAGFNSQGAAARESKNRTPLVESDSRLNAVIIRDDSSKREYYQSLINEFDQQPKMVEIEAMIIDINRSKMKDLGIDWTVKAGKNSLGVSAVATSTLDLANASLGAGSSILIKNLDHFYGRIRALEQDGEAYILAKPSVLTVDNLGAVLDLNRTAYIRLVGERVADVMPVTAGTMLKVTPRVINEGGSQRIHLVVDIEDGELQEKEGSSTPSVQRSTISTQAIIEENQALVIGGYQSQTDNRVKQRVPVLGDIPVLGGLFTRVENSNTNKERIFIIVPRAIARNYKRTYGNNVEGTPLPPSISTQPLTLPMSSNGAGRIIYKSSTQTSVTPTTINNINSTNNINSINNISNSNLNKNIPKNPFSRTADVAPPVAAKNIISQLPQLPVAGINPNHNTNNSNSKVAGKNDVSSMSMPVRNVSYLLNKTSSNANPSNTNNNVINNLPVSSGGNINLASSLSIRSIQKTTTAQQSNILNER